MNKAIAYPAPRGVLKQISPYMQEGRLSLEGAEILLSQGLPWEAVARHVQAPQWWRKQTPVASAPPTLPWRVQAWNATLRLRVPDLDIWIDPGPDAPIPIQPPNLIVVTHAHHDHTARLGDFSAAFPQVRVVMSYGTYDLLSLRADSDIRLKRCLEEQTIRIKLGASRILEDAKLTLWPAGHLLGAAMIDIELGGDAVLVTGDFALRDVGGIPGAPWLEKQYSLVLMEATTVHQDALPVADPSVNRRPFLQDVTSELERGKIKILIAAQAMGQVQELYAALVLAQQAGAFPDLKVRLTGFAETVSRLYYDALKSDSPVWHCPFYDLATNQIPPRSLVLSSESNSASVTSRMN